MATAIDVFQRVQIIMQDKSAVRWPLAELRRWTNDGLREIVNLKPTASTKTISINLEPGTRQQLPSTVIQLVRAIRNMTSTSKAAIGKSAIITVPRDLMDSQSPNWHDPDEYAPRKRVTHLIYDPEDQSNFYVWPPNDGSGAIEIVASRIPDEIPYVEPAEAMASYGMRLGLPDIYLNPLVDYVCYRAFSKDNEIAGNAERAAAHYTMMANSLGVKVQNEMKSNPNTTTATTGLAT